MGPAELESGLSWMSHRSQIATLCLALWSAASPVTQRSVSARRRRVWFMDLYLQVHGLAGSSRDCSRDSDVELPVNGASSFPCDCRTVTKSYLTVERVVSLVVVEK